LNTCLATVAPIKYEHKSEKHEATGPIVWQSGRHSVRHAAHLEMACKNGKTDQKQKQVREKNPFMGKMRVEPCQARAFGEAGTQELLYGNCAEAGKSGCQRMTMENCDAGERGAEKQIDREW
jgi:hypothetical protein